MIPSVVPGGAIVPAEGEKMVRTYLATTLSSRLLSLQADGYLLVTNLRVIFYATGASRTGQSTLQSEVPVADVSGISCYKGNYFSWKHLLTAIFLSFVIGFTANAVVTGTVLTLFVRDINDQGFRGPEQISSGFASLQAIYWITAIICTIASFRIDRARVWRSVIAATGAFFAASAGSTGMLATAISSFDRPNNDGSLSWLVNILILAIVLYTVWCYYWYAVRETMSIAIASKGGASTPIAIAGISSFGMYNTAAFRALFAEPGPGAEKMIRELGALITDIQMLGEHAMSKWNPKPNPQSHAVSSDGA